VGGRKRRADARRVGALRHRVRLADPAFHGHCRGSIGRISSAPAFHCCRW
jgi:hypothetical protein